MKREGHNTTLAERVKNRLFGFREGIRRMDLNRRHEKAVRLERLFIRNHRRNLRREGLA